MQHRQSADNFKFTKYNPRAYQTLEISKAPYANTASLTSNFDEPRVMSTAKQNAYNTINSGNQKSSITRPMTGKSTPSKFKLNSNQTYSYSPEAPTRQSRKVEMPSFISIVN